MQTQCSHFTPSYKAFKWHMLHLATHLALFTAQLVMTDSLQIGISEAQLLGLFLASVFWGILVITFVQVMKCFLWDTEHGGLKPVSKINWPMLIIALILMAVSTFDVSLGLMHCIEAFIFYTGPGGSAARFTGLNDWVNILKTCNIAIGKMVSDGVLIYRCWVVCNRSMAVVAFPILISLGGFGTLVFILYLEASGKDSQVLLTGGSSEITASTTAVWTISLVDNIFATSIIVYRIWRVDRSNTLNGIWQGQGSSISTQENHRLFGRRRRQKTRLQNVIRTVVESGLMYTTIAFISFVTFLVGSNSFYTTSDVELQILSIAFNLIIIRISARPGSDSSSHSANTCLQVRNPPIYPLRNRLTATNSSTVNTVLDVGQPDLPEGPSRKTSVSNVELAANWVVSNEQ
ncbi:hypothetical protein EV361DRAFT_958906 [Lentinula raphanica]|nr:hypothetical protein EV361DRAFT_958906 [Lentinula raphanica]